MVKVFSRTAACAAGLLCCETPMLAAAPAAKATVCGSVAGARVDVSGRVQP